MAKTEIILGEAGGGGIDEITSANGTPLSSFTFSNKSGKKLVITLVMGWSSGMDGDYCKINTISGGTILNTYPVNTAGTSGGNAYYTARCYEIDVTSNTLSFSLVKSSATYSAIFV